MSSENVIRITGEPLESYKEVLNLYEELGWNSLGLTEADFEKMYSQSWFVAFAYSNDQMVGIGRIISDGVVTGIICGLGVKPSYQQSGIGKRLMNELIHQCLKNGIKPQLICVESLKPYYEAMGFKKFASGMTWSGGNS
ncbi:acetyltransferase (GNAT) family protein [Planomicrobium soli]|uniref:Acetyltransferase (GNAT) family protein n=1 Tax=Planomicrobium soli TaxID=1176648 RepID=A0A2P8H3Y5_9BACL|nr:GNAT family N-acetyltransferase [Planomicrobium soli]PSL40935.1 acetyltransferase (GNAT) family protein [Planomicrobium soli]